MSAFLYLGFPLNNHIAKINKYSSVQQLHSCISDTLNTCMLSSDVNFMFLSVQMWQSKSQKSVISENALETGHWEKHEEMSNGR